jgi:hypothetical protein
MSEGLERVLRRDESPYHLAREVAIEISGARAAPKPAGEQTE